MTDTAVAHRPEIPPPAVTDAPGSLLAAIVTLSKDPAVDADKLERLLAMQERMEARASEAEFNRALHAAQAEIPAIAKNNTLELKDRTGKDLGSYNFLSFEDMMKVLGPIMQRHGFTVTFDMAQRQGEGGGAVMTGTLLHTAGHSKTASIPLALDAGPGRNNLQAMGSTASYGRRYVLELLFNIVRKGADDDGRTGGTKLVTVEQAAEIDTLLRETKTDAAKFLQYFEVTDVRNLSVDNYVPVKNILLTKQRRATP